MKTTPYNSAWFTRLFAAYSEWLLKRNFHSVRILGEPYLEQFRGRPLVVFANHPSWWDPIVGMVVWRRLLRERTSYVPIDSDMLRKYAFFRKLGYFGVDKNSVAGVRDFLRNATSLLSRTDTLLFITPQGRFVDVRDREAGFESGLSHVARRCPHAVFVPMAMEFSYWEEKRPEVLIRFGDPLIPTEGQSTEALNALLQNRLAEAAARLTEASVNRDTHAFQNLLSGRSGTNAVYDGWRWLKCAVRGRRFHAAHGTK